MIACISKNDRATLLFAELRRLHPEFLNLGYVRAGRSAKVKGLLSAMPFRPAEWRAGMEFSPAVARDLQRQTEERIRAQGSISHVLQWGAMYAPLRSNDAIPYSIVTDGPYDPNDPNYPGEWRPGRWSSEYFARQREVYRDAAFVFALSDWARNKLIAVHALDPERVIRIGWGPMFSVDEPNLDAASPPYFVSIGNQWRRKGMDVVAEAGHRVSLRFPEVTTIIAGEPVGMTIAPVSGVVQMPRRIALDQVRELIGGARGLLIASRFDASPHIVMEALQLGTPVVGTRVCGLPEAIGAPAGGRVVAPGDASAFADAMESLLSEDVREQRENAFLTYRNAGGWTQAAQSISKVLRTHRSVAGAGTLALTTHIGASPAERPHERSVDRQLNIGTEQASDGNC